MPGMSSRRFLYLILVLFLKAACLHGLQLKSKYLKGPVFVAGGSKGLGLEVIKKLSLLGVPVNALVRRKEALEYLQSLKGVTPTLGDAMNAADVQLCMNGCVAAVSTLGRTRAAFDSLVPSVTAATAAVVDYDGNSNVIEQAGILGIERIVLITSVGCGASKAALPLDIYSRMENALRSKTKAERDLKMYTNLDWTIVRPGRLLNSKSTGKAILVENPLTRGCVGREDAAGLIVQVLGSPPEGQYTRREFTAIDPSIKQ